MGAMLRRVLAIAVVCALGLAIVLPTAGCGEKEQTPGQQLDNVLEKTDEAAKDAGKKAGEAVEEAGKAIEEAAE